MHASFHVVRVHLVRRSLTPKAEIGMEELQGASSEDNKRGKKKEEKGGQQNNSKNKHLFFQLGLNPADARLSAECVIFCCGSGNDEPQKEPPLQRTSAHFYKPVITNADITWTAGVTSV